MSQKQNQCWSTTKPGFRDCKRPAQRDIFDTQSSLLLIGVDWDGSCALCHCTRTARNPTQQLQWLLLLVTLNVWLVALLATLGTQTELVCFLFSVWICTHALDHRGCSVPKQQRNPHL
jgi:hypothetical protein